MEIKLIPDTTVITEIATEYHTVLKIDDQYDVNITFIELLLDLNTNDKIRNITVDIEDFPSHLTIDQALDLKLEIESFVIDNISDIIKDIKESD